MINFYKIRTKILTGYIIFIIIIVLQIVLTYIHRNQAREDYNNLTKVTKPKVELLEKYRNSNKLLYILTANRVANVKTSLQLNKIKQISEVEFPFFRQKLKSIKGIDDKHLELNNIIDTIVYNTVANEKRVGKIISLLNTNKDFSNSEKIKDAKEALGKIKYNYEKIDYGISYLQKFYTESSEKLYIRLSNKINNSFYVLFISTFFLISLGLFFSFKITNSITIPLKNLINGTKDLIRGNYDTKINEIGRDEIGELTRIFNKMAYTLNSNFNDIKNKNKNLQQFTYIASHDLQEPLKTLTGFVDYLKNNYKDQFDDVGNKSLNYIFEASEKMSLLIKGLLEFNQIGLDSKLKKIDCNKVAQEVKKSFMPEISEINGTIKIKELPIIRGYEKELKLLFENLISNAIKYRKKDVPLEIIISAKKKNGWTFKVKDNGVGFEEKYINKIFLVFQRLHQDANIKGTGIGLAHCSKIMDLHNGTIWAKSKINEGSIFYFNIPTVIKA